MGKAPWQGAQQHIEELGNASVTFSATPAPPHPLGRRSRPNGHVGGGMGSAEKYPFGWVLPCEGHAVGSEAVGVHGRVCR